MRSNLFVIKSRSEYQTVKCPVFSFIRYLDNNCICWATFCRWGDLPFQVPPLFRRAIAIRDFEDFHQNHSLHEGRKSRRRRGPCLNIPSTPEQWAGRPGKKNSDQLNAGMAKLKDYSGYDLNNQFIWKIVPYELFNPLVIFMLTLQSGAYW